jgi:hypothetical protein
LEVFGRGASETIGRKNEAANKKYDPLQDLFSFLTFQAKFNLRPTAVIHRKEGTIAGNPAWQGYYLAKFPALLFFVKLRTQKGNFFKPTWKEIPQKNGWTSNRPTPIGTSIRNYFGDHHIYTNLEPTSN